MNKISNLKFLIVGPAGAGKDTIAEIICDIMGYGISSYKATSYYISFFLRHGPIEEVTEALGKSDAEMFRYSYDTVEDIWHHKEHHRERLRKMGDYLLKKDPQKLCRAALQTNEVVTGVRSIKEIKAVRELFDFIIYVKRPKCNDSTLEDLEPYCDYFIYNDGDLPKLRKKVISLLATILQRVILVSMESEMEVKV